MIKNLRNARMKDGIPKIVADQDWAYTISEVMGAMQEKLLDFTDESQIYTAIDTIPEPLLDMLAVEWKVEWYDNEYDIEQKRRVIKAAIKIRRQMGTVAAVRDTLESIFKSAKIVEWFENGGDPGTFEVEISSSLSRKDYETFARLIDTTKRASAHLRSIRSLSSIKENVRLGTVLEEKITEPIRNDRIEEKETYLQEKILLACIGEIYEHCEDLFVRTLETDLKKCALSVGTIMENTITAQLYEHKEKQEKLSTEKATGTVLEYMQSFVLQEQSCAERTLTGGMKHGSAIESTLVQKLEG